MLISPYKTKDSREQVQNQNQSMKHLEQPHREKSSLILVGVLAIETQRDRPEGGNWARAMGGKCGVWLSFLSSGVRDD